MKDQITLNSDQIAHLFKFVKSKSVKYIDLQYELVDHLASAIEDEMAQDSKITFELALSLVYNRFPINGFKEYIASTSTSLNKYWRGKLLDTFKAYFTMPRLLLTTSVFIAVLYLHIGFKMELNGDILIGAILLNYFTNYRLFKKFLGRKNTREYLFLNSISNNAVILNIIAISFFLFFNSYRFWETTIWGTCLLISLVTSLLIYSHSKLYYFPNVIKAEINNKYSHLKLVID